MRELSSRGGGLLALSVVVVLPGFVAGVLGSSVRQVRAVPSADRAGFAGLPVGLQGALSWTVGSGQKGFSVDRRRGELVARGGGVSTVFGRFGPTVAAGLGVVSFRVSGVGYGRSLTSPGRSVPVAAGSSVSYRRSGLTEWYRNGPLGLEQGFTLQQRPQPAVPGGSLTVAVRVSGPLVRRRSGSGVVFVRATGGAPLLRYGGLSAVDATGRSLPTRLQLSGRMVLLRIGDAGAHYPLTIDPFIQQGSKLTGSNEISSIETGHAQFGFAVALSSNGNTALVAGPGDNAQTGAVWVFTRSGSTWKQGPKLTAKGASPKGLPGFGFGKFGYSLALSANGDTALIGGLGLEAAWVFTRSGSTWKQGPKLVKSKQGPNGPQLQEGFGLSVALSADGNTALIGGTGDDDQLGAAYVFKRSGSTWTRQGAALIGKHEVGAPHLGTAVALSGDGNIAVIGGPLDAGAKGAAWVFTRSGSTWTQGSKLAASGESGPAQFGSAVALAADGNTALIGGYGDNAQTGAAWVFTRSGSTWTQGSKLTARAESPQGLLGFRVGLSSDGKTAVVSGPGDTAGVGSAWVFTRSGSTWTQQGLKLTATGASGGASFGYGLALASDGRTALIGGPGDKGGVGAAWVNVERS
jgi:FG-GAP repeat protein